MELMHDFRNNVDRSQSPSTRVEQGDSPTLVVTAPTREYLEPELARGGSLENGTSFEKGLYESADFNPNEEGTHHATGY